jgi:hypothetical protein
MVDGWSNWILELDQLDRDADRDLPRTDFSCSYNDSVPPHRDDDDLDIPQSERPGCATAKDFGTYLLEKYLPLHLPPSELFLADMLSRINHDIATHEDFPGSTLTGVSHYINTERQGVYEFDIEVPTTYPEA